jgi:CheY-like chemotaxis protein
LALVLHELATNAAKYGALSVMGGRLEVQASIAANGDCLISWRESGGPTVMPPSREGFGTALLDRSIPFDLGGESDVRYPPEGLTANFRIPARHVRRTQGSQGRAARAPAVGIAGDLPRDLRIMLLEDQMLIAMDVEGMFADRGFTAVSTVSSAAEALRLIARASPAAAVLDVNLGDGTSISVAERLTALGVPFVFATGYGEGGMIPPTFEDVPVVRKPYDADVLLSTLARVVARR